MPIYSVGDKILQHTEEFHSSINWPKSIMALPTAVERTGTQTNELSWILDSI